MHVDDHSENELLVSLIMADTDVTRAKAVREAYSINPADAPTIDELP